MKKTKKLKKIVIYILIVVILFLISISSLITNYLLKNQEKILWGKSTSDFKVEYKVYNNDNKFYNSEYLDDYGSYISSITDKIDFSIKYIFKTTENLDIDYTYDLYGQVLAEVYESGSTSPVWSKELDINMENTEKLGSGNYLQLNKEISIPFKEYNDMMIEYKKNYNINVSSYIKFTIQVKIDSLKTINSNISNVDTLTIKIPLLQPTYKIDIDKSVSNNRDIYLLTKNESNNIFLKIGIIGIIITILTALILFIIYKNTRTKIELFKEKNNNLLRKYEEIIITIEELPNIEGLETIEITDFNDLIDLEETLKLPIMYLNIIPNKESWFILIHNNFFYRYILKINNNKT